MFWVLLCPFLLYIAHLEVLSKALQPGVCDMVTGIETFSLQ